MKVEQVQYRFSERMLRAMAHACGYGALPGIVPYTLTNEAFEAGLAELESVGWCFRTSERMLFERVPMFLVRSLSLSRAYAEITGKDGARLIACDAPKLVLLLTEPDKGEWLIAPFPDWQSAREAYEETVARLESAESRIVYLDTGEIRAFNTTEDAYTALCTRGEE